MIIIKTTKLNKTQKNPKTLNTTTKPQKPNVFEFYMVLF